MDKFSRRIEKTEKKELVTLEIEQYKLLDSSNREKTFVLKKQNEQSLRNLSCCDKKNLILVS